MRLTSLRIRLMALAALTLLPAFALIAYNAREHDALEEADAREAVLRIAHNTAGRFGDTISETRRLLAAMSHLPAINPRHPNFSQTLAFMNKSLPQYLGLGVTLADGTMACHALPFDRVAPTNAADRLWFKRAQRNPAVVRLRILVSKEHDVLVLTAAKEALALCANGETFDLILCDLMMQDMTGMDLHRELSLVAPEQANKMIFLTGGAFTEKARHFLWETPKEHIEKPFDPANLRAIVLRFLR